MGFYWKIPSKCPPEPDGLAVLKFQWFCQLAPAFFARPNFTDKLDPYVETAFTSLSNDPYKWWLPSAESKWKLGYQNLELFYQELLAGKSHFYPRADNLVQPLDQYTSLMGGVNTRLINAPRDIKEALSIEEQKTIYKKIMKRSVRRNKLKNLK